MITMNANLPLEILDSLSECIVTLDKDFKITYINSAAERMLGYGKNSIKGKLCKSIFITDYCQVDCPIRRALETGTTITNFDSAIQTYSKEKIAVKLNATILKDKAGTPIGGVISFTDVVTVNNLQKTLRENSNFHGIVGKSKQMRNLYNLIIEISDSDAPVLIQGETGTGKEMIANAIQLTGKRKRNPFLKINCAVLPKDLLASELFGHEQGAFTNANRKRIGRFELADTGTIFLDEISEMPLQMQTHLLRILQDGTFERVGDSQTRHTDVRIIAATNLDLEKAIYDKIFREDLFFRINVIPINIPPLRLRKSDIPLLVDFFIKKFSRIYKKTIIGIEDESLERILKYNWPGNVRQLENTIEYAFVLTHHDTKIRPCSLPKLLRTDIDCDESEHVVHHHQFIPPDLLLQTLEENGWNQSKVAEIFNVNRSTIWRKLKEYGITHDLKM